MPDFSPEEQRAIVKEALQEWLDAKFAQFGKWSAWSLLAVALAAAVGWALRHGLQMPVQP